MNPNRLLAAIMPLCFLVTDLAAHDTWIEPESGSVPTGEYCYIDLMLGTMATITVTLNLPAKSP